MENYIVSARKYRPGKFLDVVGQSHITTTLKNAIKNNHLAHSFLFCGPRGVGKTTCARILAKTINCQNTGADIEACNKCESCKSFNTSSSFNIHELDAASHSSVDDMRNLIEQVRYHPQSGKYKIYIIDEVHMLSQQAFNAFLKTLEEPPSYAIFILATTEKHKIIPTILSRCQIFDFRRINIEDNVAHLKNICESEKIDADPNALHIIAQKSDGSVRDALSMFDRLISFSGEKLTYQDVLSNLNILDYEYFFKVTDALLSEDKFGTLVIFDEIMNNGFEADDFMNGLSEHFRNLFVCKDPQSIKLLEVSGNLEDRYKDQAELAPDSFLLNALKLAGECDVNYKMSKNKRLLIETALLKMCHINSVVKYLRNPQPEESGKKKASIDRVGDLKKNWDRPEEKEQPPAPAQLEAEESKTQKVEEQPEATIKKTPSLVSLQDITKEVEESHKKENSTAEKEKPTDNSTDSEAEIDQAKFLELWQTYTEKVKENKRHGLYNFMKSFEPEIVNGKEVNITVESNIQKELLMNEKNNFEQFFSKELNLPNIEFLFQVKKPGEDGKKPAVPYTSKERFEKLVEENPNIKDLQGRLGLELEY